MASYVDAGSLEDEVKKEMERERLTRYVVPQTS
jgi:hypothetical protein